MSFDPSRVYALDIETDTTIDGLDPANSRITEVVVSTAKEDVVFDHDSEAQLLVETDRYIKQLAPGLITTWNGVFFDIPFIVDRMTYLRLNKPRSLLGMLGVTDVYVDRLRTVGLNPIAQPGLKPKYSYLPGHDVGYGMVWKTSDNWGDLNVHQHLDISFAYKGFAEEHEMKHSLKPVAKAHGILMIEVDREKMHLLTPEERHDYVVSDGRGTRALALRVLLGS